MISFNPDQIASLSNLLVLYKRWWVAAPEAVGFPSDSVKN